MLLVFCLLEFQVGVSHVLTMERRFWSVLCCWAWLEGTYTVIVLKSAILFAVMLLFIVFIGCMLSWFRVI